MLALVIPGTIAAGEVWNEIAARSVIFERLRLSNLLPVLRDTNGTAMLQSFAKETLEEWAKEL
jgi:hypothetical protein